MGSNPTLSATHHPAQAPPDKEFMIFRTVDQVRRAFRAIAGFTLLALGAVMLVTPGPGWLAIFLGLGVLAAEFVWARRLLARLKAEGGRIRDAVFAPGSAKDPPGPVGKAQP